MDTVMPVVIVSCRIVPVDIAFPHYVYLRTATLNGEQSRVSQSASAGSANARRRLGPL